MKNYRIEWVAFWIVLVVFNLITSAAAAEVQRVALIPFKINAQEDLTYLRDGINDMLTTRLSQNQNVTVIQRMEVDQAVTAAGVGPAIDEAAARGVGRSLAADFVMIGSLTVLKENVSIDAKMIDVAGNRPTTAFFEQADSLGGVITRINTMAAEMNTKLFGQAPAVAAQPAAPASKAKAPVAQQTNRHAHPEKILVQGRGASDAEGGSPFIMNDERSLSSSDYWKSPNLKQPIHGVALGDVNGDGQLETVLIADHAVLIYAKTADRFLKIAELPENDNHYLVGVDVADINGNGTPEIFVSSLNALHQGLNSYVIEYDGKNFVKIVEKSRWYYRVVEPSVRGKVLIGQGHRKNDVFTGGLYELVWQAGDYVAQDNISGTGRFNALGVAMGDIAQTREEYMVAFKNNDHLQIIDGTGKTVWTGADRLGGSNLFYLLPMQDRGDVGTRRYFPTRPLVRQMPGGGKPEVIVSRNFEVAGMKLEQFRKFTGGQVEAMVWDGMGLANKWRTRKLTGFVRDFAVGDFDNDGVDELVIILIQRTGEVILTTAKSNIVAYDLVLPESEKAE